MSKLITDEYKQLMTQQHAAHKWGGSGRSWASIIAAIIARCEGLNKRPETGAVNAVGKHFYPMPVSILDYGCGRGTLRALLTDLLRHDYDLLSSFYEYDPGIPGKDALPPFNDYDYVICTDVMEHVETLYVADVLHYIARNTVSAAFFVIACRPAKATLADGRNAHIVLAEPCIWLKWLLEAFGRDFKPVFEHEPYNPRGSRLVVSMVRR